MSKYESKKEKDTNESIKNVKPVISCVFLKNAHEITGFASVFFKNTFKYY